MKEERMTGKANLLRLTDGVYAFIGEGGDSNAGAIETPDGIIVIDAQQHVPLAQAFRNSLADEAGKPIQWLVQTHYHLDHTAGSTVFAPDTPVLAHQKTLEKFTEVLGPDATSGKPITDFNKKIAFLFGPGIFDLIPSGDPGWDWFKGRIEAPEYDSLIAVPPTHTFADRFAFHLGRRTVVLEYLGPAHCDGDIIVYLPEDKIVFVADLLFYGRFPWMGDGDINGWINALDHVSKLDVEQVIPGHGLPVTLKEVDDFRKMLAALRDGVVKAAESGLSEDEAVKQVSLPDYDTLPRYGDWMPWNVRKIYRALSES
jgi:glyoxylase-like metal-dependent hydrolase (beta-lactamase superfamily II)